MSALEQESKLEDMLAAATGYRGCPEMGAIPGLVLRRRVSTVCKPWERFDQWLERAA